VGILCCRTTRRSAGVDRQLRTDQHAQSSRRLEPECQRNTELVWLTGRLMPDFKTISVVTTRGAALSRRLQHDTVAPVYSVDRSIRAQPLESPLDGIAQPIVRADHADGNIPVEVRLALFRTQ
jgi:hypothetical protein